MFEGFRLCQRYSFKCSNFIVRFLKFIKTITTAVIKYAKGLFTENLIRNTFKTQEGINKNF